MMTFITHGLARAKGAKATTATLDLSAVGDKASKVKTKKYHIKITDDEGHEHEVEAYGLDKIASTIEEIKLSEDEMRAVEEAKEEYFDPQDKIQTPSGELQMLIGMDYPQLQPSKKTVVGNIALYKSYVKAPTSLILGGIFKSNPASKVTGICCLVSGSTFWGTEELGIAAPKSCSNCKNCKACSFLSSQLSFKEQQEYQVISENLKYDHPKKRWIAKYPLTEDPKLISDTHVAASKMLESLEKRLQKTKLAKEYEDQINDFIDRGVISKMTDGEIKENPIGYTIPHNYVLKEGSTTTPLRIVTNSSYKSYKSGLSLNDITMKGPPD